jgi:histidyl-tRNA synthetase
VEEELLLGGLRPASIERLKGILTFEGTNEDKINFLASSLEGTQAGRDGLNEISGITGLLKDIELSTEIVFDLTLARGLNYYTGSIFEVVARDMKFGSICGGGRYDDLTGIFGLPGIPGVGVSFGADRIYDVMFEQQLFPETTIVSTQVMFVNFGEKEQKYCLNLAEKLRASGIIAEIYPDIARLKKQMSYADSRKISFALLVGENEMAENLVTVKEMKSGSQSKMTISELISKIKIG